MEIDPALREQLLVYQRNEITEAHIYRRLARRVANEENSRVLSRIADDEQRHYQDWRKYTQQDVEPSRWQILKYTSLGRVLGFTFAIKLMEQGEEGAQGNYARLQDQIPEAASIAHDENVHEEKLIQMLDEERLRYTGSMVLGLNDALVELTGALAGLTLALQDTQLIALSGSITGIAAAMSMAASEYLSTKSEETDKDPLRASVYTGVAYIFTVLILILPYLIFSNYYVCLALTLVAAVLIIAGFNYYVAVARDEDFGGRFLEMTGLSLIVAVLSFGVGFLLRNVLGVDV